MFARRERLLPACNTRTRATPSSESDARHRTARASGGRPRSRDARGGGGARAPEHTAIVSDDTAEAGPITIEIHRIGPIAWCD